ncbi:DNA replication/repair protein RecF [Thermus filiformis]|uniref:DNA replication and repair protein RecF n=1 Tax=Thermus filiformis TaxID=276 RepID=A0A0A2WSS4_THEFI|nr:DNA replication and repair protein RecF [Thermus filiformis]KGQ21817.2 recombination protein F [Thermus filiformis]
MRLLRLRQRNFRNLRTPELLPPPGPFALVGGNAQGKTSLLLAVHLVLGGEVRGGLLDQVRFGEKEAWLYAEVETELGTYRLEARIGPEGRSVLLGGAPVPLKEVYALPGSVLLGPEDQALVLGGKEERRGFLDRLLIRFSDRYRALLSAYEKALRQRNALLKAGQDLAAWDQALARYGSEILLLRRRLLKRLGPLAREIHRALAPGELELALEETAPPEGFLEALRSRREEERERGMTLVGPHRDDLLLLLNGRLAPRFASRGEARAIALALRLSEHRLLAEHYGEPPLLLLDEWDQELDEARRLALLAYARAQPQALLASTEPPPGLPVCWVEEGVVRCGG